VIFSLKTIALYLQLIVPKDRLEVCLCCSRFTSDYSKLLDNQNLRWSSMKMTLYDLGDVHKIRSRPGSKEFESILTGYLFLTKSILIKLLFVCLLLDNFHYWTAHFVLCRYSLHEQPKANKCINAINAIWKIYILSRVTLINGATLLVFRLEQCGALVPPKV